MPGFEIVDAGKPTDQTTVLNAVVDLLRSTVPELAGPNTCFLSMHTESLESQRQNVYATVAPMSGRFDEGIFVGDSSAAELTGVVVTVFSQMRLDRPDADGKMLTDATRGLLTLKKAILKALTGVMLQDGSGNNILFDRMRPLNAGHPGRSQEDLGQFSLAFETNFYWDLS